VLSLTSSMLACLHCLIKLQLISAWKEDPQVAAAADGFHSNEAGISQCISITNVDDNTLNIHGKLDLALETNASRLISLDVVMASSPG